MNISVKSMTDGELAKLDRELREEVRFRAAISQSTRAVLAVVAYLCANGLDAKVVAEAEFVDRLIFKDAGADLFFRRPAEDRFMMGEVKHRNFDFCSRETFPYETIIVDRATKATRCDAYFIVSRDMNWCAIITLDTEAHWKRTEIFDKAKGYSGPVFECPKALARFVRL